MKEIQKPLTDWYKELVDDLKNIIVGTNRNIAMAKWSIGDRILKDYLKFKKAEYGKKTIENLGKDIEVSAVDLWNCLKLRKKYTSISDGKIKRVLELPWRKIIKYHLTEEKEKTIKDLPKGKYEIIYADPPWQYHKQIGEGIVEEQYPTIPLEQIKSMPIQEIATEDSVLFLWITFPCLEEGLEVMEAWGFEYKTCAFNWIKLNKNGKPFFGIGHYTKSNSELCLLGIKGKGLPILDNTISQIIMTEKGKHSSKPNEIRNKITKLYGGKKRIELFARETIEGWDSWGNEVKDKTSRFTDKEGNVR